VRLLPEGVAIEAGGDLAGLDAKLAGVEDRPAVFLVRAGDGEPYLGRTSVLGRRLRRLLGERARATRFLNLRAVVARIEYWPVGSKLESAILSYELARRFWPEEYARRLKLRMPAYVKLILTNRFPRTQVTARLRGGSNRFYGPFRTRAEAESFESQFLDLFQLRRCQEDLDPSPAHPGCIYGEMNMCLRPCQQAVGVEEYASEARRVEAFLGSRGRSLVEIVAVARDRLSEEMNFEEAARQHKRMEKIQQIVKTGGELPREVDKLYGAAVTPSAQAGAVELWFLAEGVWQARRRLAVSTPDAAAVSLDHRLREVVASLEPVKTTARERQDHLALLVRWHSSSWRDGEWLPWETSATIPYRRLVNAIHRVAVTGGAGGVG